MRKRCIAISAVLGALACGDGGGGDVTPTTTEATGDATSGAPSEEMFGLRLTVLSSHETGQIDEFSVAPDDRFIVTDLRIENESHSPP